MQFILSIALQAILLNTILFTTAVARRCHNITVPVTVSVETISISVPNPKDKFDAIAFSQLLTSRTADRSSYVKGRSWINDTFDIAAQYCTPSKTTYNGKNRTNVIQFLTHGLGFDRSYWDFSLFNYNYSYVNAALAQGYSTFAIDRLSVAGSSKPSPEIPQLGLENAINTELTRMLRQGTCHDIPPQRRVIHIGHSYGAALTNTLVTLTPDMSDAIVLTGWSHESSYIPVALGAWLAEPAAWNQPSRFGTQVTYDCHGQVKVPLNLPLGYQTWLNVLANQYSFFSLPMFDKVVLNYAEATKQPYTVGEAFTLDGFMTTNFTAPAFTGPVLMATGELDKIYCNSNCTGIMEPSAAKFPQASKFQTHIQPGTGHAMNLHYNSTGLYRTIMAFLADSGF